MPADDAPRLGNPLFREARSATGLVADPAGLGEPLEHPRYRRRPHAEPGGDVHRGHRLLSPAETVNRLQVILHRSARHGSFASGFAAFGGQLPGWEHPMLVILI